MSRFLLVSLNIKAILRETTLHRRREKLRGMENGWGLGDAYDATIGRIKAQEEDRARLGMEALMWISHSERPLSTDEICHALAVEIGSTNIIINNVSSIRRVLDCCQGLATIDKGSSTIRLIHFTLKKYLNGHAELFGGPHSKIAETCLTYLNFQAIRNLSASPSRDPRGTPFLRCSSLYWGTHMRMELSDRSRHLALELLDQYDNHISAELLWESVKSVFFIRCIGYHDHTSTELRRKSTISEHLNSRMPFSALHCISYFGIAEVALNLIRAKRWDVNQRDSVGLTPLIWAARYGCEQVVELLLQQKGTQPDMRDVLYGRTALSWAAGSGHEGVVRLLLGPRFVHPGSVGRRWGKTAQIIGALSGRKYVNPSKPDDCGRTPLSWAAENGHDRAVKLLLEREGVSPDKPDNYSQTPLSCAAYHGHDGVVKLLLEREDVSPDKPNKRGQTPLSRAAYNGHDAVVKLLLERKDVSPDRLNNFGQTPLLSAAKNGRDGVVKLLLGREDVNPDRPDMDGQTPLVCAAENGHDRVVKLLLEREDVNPDMPDNYGKTPLSWAARNGHDGVVELLLEREDIIPDRPDNYGQTPLLLATWNGRDGVVKLLKARMATAHVRYKASEA